MASTTNNTVNINGRALKKEGIAAGTLTVGQHVTYAAGEIDARGAGSPTRMIVTEAPERGKSLLDADDAYETYAAGEQVPFICCTCGDEALILLANGENVNEGDILEAAASGEWAAQTTGDAGFMAREDLNNTSGAAQLIWAQAV